MSAYLFLALPRATTDGSGSLMGDAAGVALAALSFFGLRVSLFDLSCPFAMASSFDRPDLHPDSGTLPQPAKNAIAPALRDAFSPAERTLA